VFCDERKLHLRSMELPASPESCAAWSVVIEARISTPLSHRRQPLIIHWAVLRFLRRHSKALRRRGHK
jgi:hypothetical protein